MQMKKTVADFQQMIQERVKKVEEIKSCLKLSNVSPVTEMFMADTINKPSRSL